MEIENISLEQSSKQFGSAVNYECEHRAAYEQPERRERFLSYWCHEGILATCTDAYEINILLMANRYKII